MFDYKQKQYYDTGCQEHRCSLCHFHGPVHFLFHGLSDDSSIDRRYVFIPYEQKTKGVEWVGYSGNKIKWEDDTSQWVIINNIKSFITFLLNSKSFLTLLHPL